MGTRIPTGLQRLKTVHSTISCGYKHDILQSCTSVDNAYLYLNTASLKIAYSELYAIKRVFG